MTARPLLAGLTVTVGIAVGCAAGGQDPGGGLGPGGSGGTPPACISSTVATHPFSFEVFKIADAAPTGAFPSLKFGPDGLPLLVFLVGPAGEEQIVAARIENGAGGGTAPAAQIVQLSQPGPTLTPPRVAATRDGAIAVVYLAASGGASVGRYVAWTGRLEDSPIDTQPVSDATDGAAPAILPDRSGQPVAAFVYNDGSLRLLTSLGGETPSRETVAIGVSTSSATRIGMTLDSQGVPAVVRGTIFSTALNGGPSGRGFTVWIPAAAGWTMERAAHDHLSARPIIRLSPEGDLTIFITGGGLARATRSDGVWRVEDPIIEVAGRYPSGQLFDAAFGAQGEIHLAYAGSEGLVHAVVDGCRWSETVVHVHGAEASIALDAGGRPHIAFQRQIGVVEVTGTEISEVWYARPR